MEFDFLSPAERFLIYLLLGIFVFLVIGIVVAVFINFFMRGFAETDSENSYDRETNRSAARARTVAKEASGSDFEKKLGEKVVHYMIDITKSADKNVVSDRIAKIKAECEKLSGKRDLPAANKKIISTVMVWAKKFNVDRHLSDMKIVGSSTQVIYNDKKRDFKLRIAGD